MESVPVLRFFISSSSSTFVVKKTLDSYIYWPYAIVVAGVVAGPGAVSAINSTNKEIVRLDEYCSCSHKSICQSE